MQVKREIRCYESGLLLNEFKEKYRLIQLNELQKGLGVQYSYSQTYSQNTEFLEDTASPNSILINICKEIPSEYSPLMDSNEWVFLNVIILMEFDFFNDFANKELKNPSDTDFTKFFKDSEFLEKLGEITTKLIQNLEVNLFSTQLPASFFEAWVYQYLYEMSNATFETHNPRSTFFFKQDDIEKIQKLESIIKNTRVNSMPSITEMAESVEMSPTKFKKIFKEVFGKSSRQYILDIKIKQAQSLLKSNGHSLTQVAHKLGFNNTSGLARLLKNKI